MRFRVLIVLALAALLCNSARSLAQVSSLRFSLSGTRILKNGSEFVVHGVCVNGPGMPGNRAIVQDAALIADTWKFNLVRVGCMLKPTSGVRAVNDLDEIVRTFTARGIVVLIDPRDHVGGYYQNPASPAGSPSLSDLIAWYKEVATRYRNNPAVWFEVMSGPGSREDRKGSETWLDTHERVVEAIRRDAASTNIIVCEGRFRGSDTSNNGALPVNDMASAILSSGPELARKYSNLLFAFHTDDAWNAGAPKLIDFLDRVHAAGLPVFVSEYGSLNWADSTPAAEAMLAVCKNRRIGRCVWNWSPTDNQQLCAPDGKGGGWQIDTFDGSKPGNLSWFGDRVWDDNHGLAPLHGALLDRDEWTATAFATPAGRSDRGGQPDAVFSPYIIPEDYWSSNKEQTPGQWFQIDMGKKRTFSRIMADPRNRYGDYPRGYELYVSNDGVNWGAPIARGKNEQSVLRLTFAPQTARYIKLVQTEKTWHHWVIANIEVYAPIGAKANAASVPHGQEVAILPRAWSATAGPNHWYDADAPLRPRQDENRYTANGQGQNPGHYYQVDMAEPQRFNQIMMNCGRGVTDFPRGFDVQVSSDGIEWSKPIASGRGSPVTVVTFPTQTARYVRVTLTRSCRNYWALAEFRVYAEAAGGNAGQQRP